MTLDRRGAAYSLLSPDQLEAIGELAFATSKLELRIEWVIWGLADLDGDEGRAITTGSQFKGKCLMLDALLRLRCQTEEETRRTGEIRELCKNVGWNRRRVIHGMWDTNKHGQNTTQLQYRTKPPSVSVIGINEIVAFSEEVEALQTKIIALYGRLQWTSRYKDQSGTR